MTEQKQTNIQDWVKQELETTKPNQTYDKIPALKLEDGTITSFEVLTEIPPGIYTSEEGTIKRILAIMHKGERKNLWLNVKNPLYRDILMQLDSGNKKFTVSTTGKQKETRYTLVKEA